MVNGVSPFTSFDTGTAAPPAGTLTVPLVENVASVGEVPYSKDAVEARPPGFTVPESVACVPVTPDDEVVVTRSGSAGTVSSAASLSPGRFVAKAVAAEKLPPAVMS